MPKTTFINLNEEKKNRLIAASFEEFSKEAYNNASINRIIKKANIPRGSFYMYFTDKEDLYFHLMSEYKKLNFSKAKDFLINNNGDIIKAFKDMFNYIVEDVLNKEDSEFFKRVILNMDYIMENKILRKEYDTKEHSKEEIFKHIDKSILNIESEYDLFNMLNTIMILSIHKLIEIIRHKEHKDIIHKTYNRQMELLSKGFYKEVKNENI